MRLLTQAHLDLRAARERRRADVADADGDVRGLRGRARAGPGDDLRAGAHLADRLPQEKQGEPVPAGRGAELGAAGVLGGDHRRNAGPSAAAPFGQAAAQVSAQGAIHLGKRQSEELAVAAAADFEAFYAARRPEPCDPATGLLLTADGSAFPVLPERAAARDREGRRGPRGRRRGLRLAG